METTRDIWKTAFTALKQVVPNGINVVDIPEKIINTILQTDEESKFMEKIVSRETFYRDWLLRNMPKVVPLERDLLIIDALLDDSLSVLLSNVACVPVSQDGVNLKTIGELIDPDSDIAKLFDTNEEKFPLWDSEAIARYKDDMDKCLAD